MRNLIEQKLTVYTLVCRVPPYLAYYGALMRNDSVTQAACKLQGLLSPTEYGLTVSSTLSQTISAVCTAST